MLGVLHYNRWLIKKSINHNVMWRLAAYSAFTVVGDVHGLPVDIKHAIKICFINWQGRSQARLSSNYFSLVSLTNQD